MQPLERNVPVSARIADLVRSGIDDGTYPVGTRIPTEVELAATLGVSRNSVREALRSLVHSGLLTSRAGDGTYVRSRSELGPAIARRGNAADWADVLDVRFLIERHAARAAASRATPDDIAALRAVLEARDTAATPVAFVAEDLAFHRGVVRLAGNPLLAEIYEGLDGVETFVASVTPPPDAFRPDEVAGNELTRLHHALLDAVASGDPDAAERAAADLAVEAVRS